MAVTHVHGHASFLDGLTGAGLLPFRFRVREYDRNPVHIPLPNHADDRINRFDPQVCIEPGFDVDSR